jgi:excisionase family DNA binding protein
MKLTTTQIAAKLGISERTVQRWIASGRLSARQLARNLYFVEEANLDNLTKHNTSDNDASDLRQWVEVLEQRIRHLEDTVRRIAPFRILDTQQVVGDEINVESISDSLSGLDVVLVRTFARQHGLTWEQMQGMISKDAFEVIYRPYGNKGLSRQVLTPQQQTAVIKYLQANDIPYKQCKYCPH